MRSPMPLRIPAGWAVGHNALVEFHAADPPPVDGDDDLAEDLLQLHSCALVDGAWHVDPHGFTIDVGWYPAGDPSGAFALVVVQPDFQGESVLEVRHPEQRVICAAIESCARLLSEGLPPAVVAATVHDIVAGAATRTVSR